MKLLYFAWVRSKVGVGEETVRLPDDVRDVGGLLDWLAARSPGHAAALTHRQAIRVAVNQEYVKPDHAVRDGDEVAIFPPVTGG